MRREDWIPVPDCPGYSVNPLGQVRNDRTKRILQVRANQYGVPYVGMMVDGLRHQRVRSVALLVANAFIPRKHPEWDTPVHLDGDRMNCRADNIVWRPLKYAEHYNNQFTKGRYENPIECPVRDAETDDEYDNSLHAACHNGLLEREVVLSILNNTVAWPTYQRFVISD